MATISRSGITTAQPIQATHITNIIDALDGTSTTTTVVATGSFKGNLAGTASWASQTSTTPFSGISGLPDSLSGGNANVGGVSKIIKLSNQGYTSSVDLSVGGFNYCDTSTLSGNMQIQLAGGNPGDEYTFFWLTGSRGVEFVTDTPATIITSENGYKKIYTSGSIVTAKFLGDSVDYEGASAVVWVLVGSLKA